MFKKLALAALLALTAPTLATAAEEVPPLPIVEAGDQSLDDFLWQARLVVVFADSPMDPNFVRQMEYLEDRPGDLAERDVVVIIDTDPDAMSPIRTELRPRGFDIVLIGKDGQKYLRKPFPWDVRELTRSIDKMPIRQQEQAERRLVR